MGSVFRFKQFEVDQTGCAMKINTDGVLLGAVAEHPAPVNILDIGTGTGVIALMMAQRFPSSLVNAVEIDESAALAAAKNCLNSPFTDRTSVVHSSFEDFTTALKYSLIVSNPPYFVNDLKNPEKRKEIARHADEDFFDLLLKKAAGILTEDGLLWLILPVKQAESVVVNAVLQKLFPARIIHVYSDQTKASFRQIICLGFADGPLLEEHMYIYEEQNLYTDQYKCLLRDFLLAF
ncbi:tRNA1(Val) (adenine(37)-N6)-methyltransferase [Pedobacter cryoconitis]|uniref:tRNA1(Val) (adenine(37)-N6)-methyltransferase n=1 Tax=Pedobacter cryoconitis TaxID=188932 RepID=A0A327SGZ0_9SPHI|nr:methyltransferase [Pedobacter cryoconitis]RAJ28390.1 tRNA1Val (adenine37-N6)-methyltransferase [Pedobacter cryoconitis]